MRTAMHNLLKALKKKKKEKNFASFNKLSHWLAKKVCALKDAEEAKRMMGFIVVVSHLNHKTSFPPMLTYIW